MTQYVGHHEFVDARATFLSAAGSEWADMADADMQKHFILPSAYSLLHINNTVSLYILHAVGLLYIYVRTAIIRNAYIISGPYVARYRIILYSTS